MIIFKEARKELKKGTCCPWGGRLDVRGVGSVVGGSWWALMIVLAWAGGSLGEKRWTTGEVLEKVQVHYSQIRTLQAQFEQETTLPTLNRVTRARGVLYLRLPGKMRWEYLEGQEKIIIINGSTMWFYEPQEGQVTITDLARVPDSQELLTFLTGVGDLRKDFLADEESPAVKTTDGNLMVQLFPKSASSQWKSLKLVVDPKSFNVVQTAFDGIQGERTIISYRGFVIDQELGEDLFTFHIPPGVEVLHYPRE